MFPRSIHAHAKQLLQENTCYLCCARGQDFLCSQCMAQIPWVTSISSGSESLPIFCRRCGCQDFSSQPNWQDPSDARDISQSLAGFPTESLYFCSPCSKTIEDREIFITRNFPIAYYCGIAKELLQWYKFSKETAVAKFFAQLVYNTYQARFTDFFIVPVPPRPTKIRQDAWDQVEYLCRILHKRYRIPILHLLERKSGKQQKYLNRENRITNMRDAYFLALPARRIAYRAVRDNAKKPIKILLLDDVYTTGATIDMCRQALVPLDQEKLLAEICSLSLVLVP